MPMTASFAFCISSFVSSDVIREVFFLALSTLSFGGVRFSLRTSDQSLRSHNYAVVSDFADVARIHLRRYKLDATGSLLPTKDGITVTPSVWLALVREFSAIDQAFDDGKVFIK
ncbi:PC4 domain-containing protein [Trichonephila inaurata madagascariensis]|uniref:PC4 domain-containing protein n=1 Tax=Trichonephila inaurata madagascariensis TaxID=2747483 RepID=A0A8X6K0G0_9ARAC|nr:PC4 domain-containing protein [Trichonephila inaurata madagascariensis]